MGAAKIERPREDGAALARDLSVLGSASRADVRLDPFPHVVINNALDKGLFDQLAREFPAPQVLLEAEGALSDTWYDYPAQKVLHNSAISPRWREFFSYHVSDAFFGDVARVFGEAIRALYPKIERQYGKRFAELECAMRCHDKGRHFGERPSEVLTECQFFLNYARRARTIRGPHVDRPTELYAGLLYFRHEDDESTGGDLQICRVNEAATLFPDPHTIRIAESPRELDWTGLEVTETIEYAANTLVFFLNSPRSIHAITERSASPIPRRHINFCADVVGLPGTELFNVDVPAWAKLRRKLRRLPLLRRVAPYVK